MSAPHPGPNPSSARAQGMGNVLTHTRQARQLIVHHGGHMELEELHVLCNDMGRRAILLIAPKLIVDLHDVSQFVSQVILR